MRVGDDHGVDQIDFLGAVGGGSEGGEHSRVGGLQAGQHVGDAQAGVVVAGFQPLDDLRARCGGEMICPNAPPGEGRIFSWGVGGPRFH